MITIAFFNNKGGVGKTTLVYHLMWMLSELGYRVLGTDLDPQANLTSMTIDEERLTELWEKHPRPTVYSAIEPLKKGIGEVSLRSVETISSRVSIAVGDLELSSFEDDLSASWASVWIGMKEHFALPQRSLASFHKPMKFMMQILD